MSIDFFVKVPRQLNKKAFPVNDIGITGYLYEKNSLESSLTHIYTDKLKMGHLTECTNQNYNKTSGRNRRK